mmetsp:Transcript_4006/g.11166  ORF Transcript_4006/g.11166 Transcript_4006/m.11166 type:complete len:282 (+) Transcript_4006:120-965(+)
MRMVVLSLVMALCVAAQQVPVDPKVWSYATGQTYLLMSYAAYCPEVNIRLWDCKWCQYNTTVQDFDVSDIFEEEGELVFMGVNPTYKEIVVSFRGSTDITNWINNFQVFKVNYPFCDGCKVHKGFYDTWESLRSQVLDGVSQLFSKYGYDIIVTGHSLGGAVASLASVEIKNTTGANVYLWNYGCPRVGNENYANWLPSSASGVSFIQRVVNNHDIVPQTPAEWQKYRHYPQEIWEQADPNNFIMCDPNNGEDPTCSDSVVGLSVDDHLTYFGLYEECELT